MDDILSSKLEELKNNICKLQLEINEKGWNIDLERVLILLEINIDGIRRYEKLDENN